MSDLIEAAPAELPQPTDFIGNQAFIWAYEELRRRYAREFSELVLARHEVLTAPDTMELDIDGPRFEQLVVLVSQLCRVSVEEIIGRSRIRSVGRARLIAMWAARQYTAMSFLQIAARFERDHTTIVSACQRIDALLVAGDATYTQLVHQLNVAMRSHMAIAEEAA